MPNAKMLAPKASRNIQDEPGIDLDNVAVECAMRNAGGIKQRKGGDKFGLRI
jgi:hypothetical protein